RAAPRASPLHGSGDGTRPDGQHCRGRALPAPLAPAGSDADGAGAVAPAGRSGASLGPSGSPPRPTGAGQGRAQEPPRCAPHGGRTKPADAPAKDRGAGTAYGCVISVLLNRSVF